MGRIVCMEELQLGKVGARCLACYLVAAHIQSRVRVRVQWNPVREINEILGSIRRLLTTYGAVDDEGGVNDPKASAISAISASSACTISAEC